MKPVRMCLIFPLIAAASACGCKAQPPQRGTIEEAAAKAKSAGQSTTELKSGVVLPAAVLSYSDEMERGYALHVRALSRISLPTDDHTRIGTWYKFAVLSDLSRHPFRPSGTEDAPPDPDIPQQMLPLEPNQILIAESGGRVISDGVSVIYRNAGEKFVPGKEYLVIVEPAGSSHWVFVLPSTDSAYAIAQDGDKLIPLDTQGVTSLHEDIKRHFGDSLRSAEQAKDGGSR